MKMLVETIPGSGGQSVKLTRLGRAYQKLSRAIVRRAPYLPSQNRYNLSIGKSHEFLWFRVAKVGTRSILKSLRMAGVEFSAEHPYNVHYPVKYYNKYYKFAFVRNPWDRLVSAWKDKVINSNYFNFNADELQRMRDFEAFIQFVNAQNIQTCDIHIRAQSDLIDLNNIDFIGRFENFNEDVSRVFAEIGLNDVNVFHENASLRDPASEYHAFYSTESRDLVGSIYERDIRMFGYDF